MSLNHIEALTEALGRAKLGEMSDSEFQVIVLQGLISLKESHVSLRSRLFNLEGRGFMQQARNNDTHVPPVHRVCIIIQDLFYSHADSNLLSSCLHNWKVVV